jgi:carboxyl-terminal processing protease
MPQPSIGMLKLIYFSVAMANEIRQAVRQLLDQGAQGLILDMRECGAGHPPTTREIAGLFLPAGSPLWLKEDLKTGERELIRATTEGEFVALPLVVLVDGQTQGELPVAAIKRNQRARIIGQKTSGLCVVMSLDKKPDGSSSLVTTGKYFMTPQEPISGSGITPDIEVPEGASEEEMLKIAIRELKKELEQGAQESAE